MQFIRALALGAAVLLSAPLAAQDYPSRPIKLVVTLSPGSTSDILARTVGEHMSKSLGQPIVVENRPGLGGNIAGEAVAKSPNDGYTLLLATISSHGINPSLFAKMPYDALRDFVPVIALASSPNALIVSPEVPVSSVKELVAYVKSKPPGEVNYASAGIGTSHHLGAELFGSMIGAKMTHVPYKGSPDAVTAVATGQVTLMFPNIPNALPLAKAGKVKLLAVTTPKRLAWLPDTPTVAESLPGFAVIAWFGLVAPAGTPPAIVQRLNAEAQKALADPAVRQRLVDQGFDIMGGSAPEFGAFMKNEIDKWAAVVKTSGAKVE
jgi:tripartite-type tricarboxylate transporter receptor subunit TctC